MSKDFNKNTDVYNLNFPMRLDLYLVEKGISFSRSRAEEYIRSGFVSINGLKTTKAGQLVHESDKVNLSDSNPYVSRAALKLVGANKKFKVQFAGKTVLDVGSSTGGFTEYALKAGAKKVIAVDVGTNQMHPKVASDNRVELHEKTDIRVFKTKEKIDIVVCDVSFISLRYVLPDILRLVTRNSQLILMCKPQFEAGKGQTNKGVVKNESIRRKILTDFETWLKTQVVVLDKIDSDTPGEKGNVERFYLCKFTK
ncbi:TlyA family RNA methyltransferase [Candidatus Saccharibacteria bacterium]|nr:TlyA family RNA methyltransferase [Candidatus Saccharibacteria bacterium]